MRKWTLVVGGFLLILSFQNCQKASVQNVASDTSKSFDYQKSSTASFQTLQMWDYDQGRTVDVDVSSGKMSVYLNYGADRGADYCLSDSERQQLQSILASAEVCQPVLPAEQYTNQECTQLYRYPYAVLVDQGTEVRLGEMTNGCDVPTDLCGANAAALQNYVQGVLQTLEQQTCQ